MILPSLQWSMCFAKQLLLDRVLVRGATLLSSNKQNNYILYIGVLHDTGGNNIQRGYIPLVDFCKSLLYRSFFNLFIIKYLFILRCMSPCAVPQMSAFTNQQQGVVGWLSLVHWEKTNKTSTSSIQDTFQHKVYNSATWQVWTNY